MFYLSVQISVGAKKTRCRSVDEKPIIQPVCSLLLFVRKNVQLIICLLQSRSRRRMKTRSRISLHSMADYLDCLVEHFSYSPGNSLARRCRTQDEKPQTFSSERVWLCASNFWIDLFDIYSTLHQLLEYPFQVMKIVESEMVSIRQSRQMSSKIDQGPLKV